MTYSEKIATDFGVTDLEKSRSILGNVVISWGQAETVDFPRPNRWAARGLSPLLPNDSFTVESGFRAI
ncbi:MAG: hypothetical protein BJG00_004175 [Limnothrix sp. CACIAM 69d]|nr:MAG: hypothetical protein BJG00_004175 [Limnothrix sp. CACIAM 69d]